MRYEILGPLRVTDKNESLTIGAPKVNLVLALLISRADQPVSAEQIISEIWGDRAPRRATAGLHVYISQLRKFLRRTPGAETPIVTRPPGYLLCLGSDELDLNLFQKYVDRGRAYARAQRHEDASTTLRSALALWRGPALSDLASGPVVGSFVGWAEESRLACIETLVESDLALGRHQELVGRLYRLTAEHPLREVFYRQLMLALYRSERQAEALEVYRSARTVLNDELGMEPCRAMREVHQAILLADDFRLMTPAPPRLSAVS